MSEPVAPAQAGAPRSAWRRVRSSPWSHLVLAVLVVALVQAFFVKVYAVPSGSMEQTLEPGDRVLVNRLAYLGEGLAAGPQTGDVVVFDRPDDWGGRANERPWWRIAIGWLGDVVGFGPSNSDALTKRVIGTPGDRVACCDAEGRVTVNDRPLDEPYVYEDLPFGDGLDCTSQPGSLRCFDEVTLGDDEYLVLGDHRSDSVDSVADCRGGAGRATAPPDCARTVPRADIVGRVFFVVWPPSPVG